MDNKEKERIIFGILETIDKTFAKQQLPCGLMLDLFTSGIISLFLTYEVEKEFVDKVCDGIKERAYNLINEMEDAD